jgi:hypothetical protein
LSTPTKGQSSASSTSNHFNTTSPGLSSHSAEGSQRDPLVLGNIGFQSFSDGFAPPVSQSRNDDSMRRPFSPPLPTIFSQHSTTDAQSNSPRFLQLNSAPVQFWTQPNASEQTMRADFSLSLSLSLSLFSHSRRGDPSPPPPSGQDAQGGEERLGCAPHHLAVSQVSLSPIFLNSKLLIKLYYKDFARNYFWRVSCYRCGLRHPKGILPYNNLF